MDEATYLAIFGHQSGPCGDPNGATSKGAPLSPSHNSDGLSSDQSFASSSAATSPVCSNDSGATCFQTAGVTGSLGQAAANLSYANSIDWVHFLADHSQLASSTGAGAATKWLQGSSSSPPLNNSQQVYYQTAFEARQQRSQPGRQQARKRGRAPKGAAAAAANRPNHFNHHHNYHQQPPSNLNHRQQQNQRHLSSPWSSAAAALQFSMQLSGSSPPPPHSTSCLSAGAAAAAAAARDLSGRSATTPTAFADHDYISQQVAFGSASHNETTPTAEAAARPRGRAKRTSRRPAHLDDDYVGVATSNPTTGKTAAKRRQQKQRNCDQQQIDLSNNLPNMTTTSKLQTSNHLKHNLSQQFFQYNINNNNGSNNNNGDYYQDSNKQMTSSQNSTFSNNNFNSTTATSTSTSCITSLNNLQASEGLRLGLNMTTTGTIKTASPLSPVKTPSSGRKPRRENRKCRKVYGMDKRELWCTQCKWKKACSRFCDQSNE